MQLEEASFFAIHADDLRDMKASIKKLQPLASIINFFTYLLMVTTNIHANVA